MESSRLAGWLAQGLGRAVVFLKQTDARPYRDLILCACTHNQVFDRQVEDGRDLFLYDVLTATDDMGYYRRPLFAALMEGNEEHDPHQLFGLVRRMAQAGDWEARNCLYAAFDRQVAHEDFRGASEFIALDGLRGFLFVTTHFLRCKQAGVIEEANSNKDNSDWEWWLSELEERDGKDATQAARDFLNETDADSLYAYTAIFMRRTFPMDADFTLKHSSLLTLARSSDAEQAWRAAQALGSITHPAVRNLGLELLTDPQRAAEGVNLLVKNFEESDYALLERALRQLEDRDLYHTAGYNFRSIAEAHLTPQAVPSLLLLYENGPCSLCRHHCVELLLKLDALPDSLRAECRYDADEETRLLVTASQ